MNVSCDLQWIELDKKALLNNIRYIRSLLGDSIEIAALLKANAYGHGLAEMVPLYLECEVKIFMVHSITEALNIKHPDGCRIIILGPLSEKEMKQALIKSFEFIVYTENHLKWLKKIVTANKKLQPKIHVKVETGTNRQGVTLKNLPLFINNLKKIRHSLKGLSTHFANIEDTSDKSFYKKQLQNFRKAAELFKKNGLVPEQYHTACSAAAVMYPETHYDLIRPGIALYGYSSSKEMSYAFRLDKKLKPLLTWKTRIAQIKTVAKGQGIGYGLSYQTTRKTKIGVLPIGYYDGYDRALSNSSFVIVNDSPAPVRGRICMNLMMIDLTDIKNVREGDEVILIGKTENCSVTADDLAELSGTISYEILARLNPLIPRIII